MYGRILIPLDGKTSSEGILPHVKTISQGMGSEMILLHVIPTPAPEFSVSSRPFAKNIVSEHRESLTRYLKKTCGNLEKEGARTTYLIREGAVADTILEVAGFMKVDLIAMSTQGRPAAQILLLGNVTYQVVRHSPLPMLVIRSKQDSRPPRGRRAKSV